jgi:hypothetical protein
MPRRVWISEKLTRENYKAVLLEPVTFYPKEQPSEQVSLGALNDIRAYIDAGVRKTITETLPTAPAAGPGIVRTRPVCTVLRPRFLTPQQYRCLHDTVKVLLPAFQATREVVNGEVRVLNVETQESASPPRAAMEPARDPARFGDISFPTLMKDPTTRPLTDEAEFTSAPTE